VESTRCEVVVARFGTGNESASVKISKSARLSRLWRKCTNSCRRFLAAVFLGKSREIMKTAMKSVKEF